MFNDPEILPAGLSKGSVLPFWTEMAVTCRAR